jgi:hypothetical protein
MCITDILLFWPACRRGSISIQTADFGFLVTWRSASEIIFSPKTRTERANQLLIFMPSLIIVSPSSEKESARNVSGNNSLNAELDLHNSNEIFII